MSTTASLNFFSTFLDDGARTAFDNGLSQTPAITFSGLFMRAGRHAFCDRLAIDF